MKKYRFKTREEFELIGRWIDKDECPEGWTEEMNEYLGEEILGSDCIALCESNDDFDMDGWSFSNHDYVIIETVETIDKNLLIDCSSEAEASKVFDYLESQGEKTNRAEFSFNKTRSPGNWYFIGYYSVREAWTVAREGNNNFGNKVISAKEFLGKPEEKSLVGRWVKILSRFSSDQPVGSYDLIIEDDEKRSCINLEKYRMCARERLTDGDLELMPVGWSPESETSSKFKIGDWIIWDGSYKSEPLQLASIEDGGHKDTNGNWRDTKSPYYRLALPHEIFDKNAKTFPTKWCLKITDDNKYTLDAWRKAQPKYKEMNVSLMGWLTCDHRYGSYLSYAHDVPDGYTKITFEQFKTNVLCSSLFLDSKDVISKSWQDGLKGTLYNPTINPILVEDVMAFGKKYDKPLIENVQSISVNLRTKKQINKLKF